MADNMGAGQVVMALELYHKARTTQIANAAKFGCLLGIQPDAFPESYLHKIYFVALTPFYELEALLQGYCPKETTVFYFLLVWPH